MKRICVGPWISSSTPRTKILWTPLTPSCWKKSIAHLMDNLWRNIRVLTNSATSTAKPRVCSSFISPEMELRIISGIIGPYWGMEFSNSPPPLVWECWIPQSATFTLWMTAARWWADPLWRPVWMPSAACVAATPWAGRVVHTACVALCST